jgi:hypothetical protein
MTGLGHRLEAHQFGALLAHLDLHGRDALLEFLDLLLVAGGHDEWGSREISIYAKTQKSIPVMDIESDLHTGRKQN